ncbi:hypothetical protein L6452_13158 [Arctium lappa]|uniref:Uncharacterized protein n=1 Tax=Arctium lappa TaxID=4217 RepID=A0ACB9CHI2_ARCLA|nr:hypothetical protein L6452_13158 [Arctium lappa]
MNCRETMGLVVVNDALLDGTIGLHPFLAAWVFGIFFKWHYRIETACKQGLITVTVFLACLERIMDSIAAALRGFWHA